MKIIKFLKEKEKKDKSVTIRELTVKKQKVLIIEKAIEYLKKKI